MKPYEELTFRGKILRLRKLCIKALENYLIDVARVRYLTTESTTMFRVDTTDGSKYVIRLYSEFDSSLAENQTEMFWLAALARDTDLRVVESVARKDGDYITFVSMEGIPNEKRCALYKWVPGVQLAEHISPKNYEQFGQIVAQMHNHAEGLELPNYVQPKRWDKVFYFPDEPVVYNTPEYTSLFTAEQLSTLETTIDRVSPFLAGMYRDSHPFIIHGDLHYWNVHISRGKLHIIDFEDMVFGFPLQDIAISFYYLRNRKDYKTLTDAFLAGYARERNLPPFNERDLHLLWMARMANFVNYVAHMDEPEDAKPFIESRCRELGEFLAKVS
ncbi:MAG: phosphotransferase [Anaerolineae bacterium]|mgnify:FL=1|jgi:Ser/Thr protein kinase RdoA (MazF antagonist)|nr:phosphotransferase [Anaerolineae bacterium]MBT3711834.1 phosphotransferase [Anaerolineae bacterium]MBT7190027.1 phosphotransferase [Anaerolineae bacterium]MBT7989683.1 phosphotransferase [Anaerolineae bacterium]